LEITTNSPGSGDSMFGERGSVWLLEDRWESPVACWVVSHIDILVTHWDFMHLNAFHAPSPSSRWRTVVPLLQEFLLLCVVAKIHSQFRSWVLILHHRFSQYRGSWEQGPLDIRWLGSDSVSLQSYHPSPPSGQCQTQSFQKGVLWPFSAVSL
jgi:hypothetical protein